MATVKKRRRLEKRFRPGDIVRVYWIDIVSDSVGNPLHAAPALRDTVGYFLAVCNRPVKGLDYPVKCLVCTSTNDGANDTENSQSGWDCYPWSCVVAVEKIKDVQDIKETVLGRGSKRRGRGPNPCTKGRRRAVNKR